MIQEFNNVSRKSFKNYTSKDLNLQPVNVIFGMNGSGKSALAEWLYDSSRTDTQLFNTDYVEREIRVRSSINGVRLIVGSDIEETEKVEEKRKERDKIKKDIAGIESEMENAKNSLADRIQEIFTKESKKFNNIKIRQKPNLKVQPHVVFEKWKQEAKNGEDLSEDQDISGNDDIERRIDALKTRFNEAPQPFEKEDIELVQKELITQLSRIVIKPHEEFTQSLLDWLSSGKELHDQNVERQTCKFCGNEFITREVFKRIENAVSAEYSQFCQKLNSLSQALERIKKSFTTITQKKEMNDSDESSLEKEIEFFLNALCEKQKDTETPINCDSSRVERLIKSLYNTQEGIIGSRDKIKRDIDNWEDKLKHQEDLAKMHIGRSISSDAVCVNNYNNYIDRHDCLVQKTERLDSLKRDIQNYKLQKSNLGEFEKIVNHVFEQEGIPFSIIVDDTGHSYTLVSKEDPLSSTRAPITANDLSEGEIRLLGFLHFYLSLYEGTKIRNSEKEKINLQQFSPTVDTIVIDDPVTSLDLNNRFTLLEIINKLSKQVVDQHKQLFILTHSPFDFNDYAFHCSKDNKTRLRIYKDENGNSVIARYEHDVFNNYYHEQFNFVMQFALDGKENIQLIENPVKYANPMRFVLESHARTHYGISDFTQKNYDKIKEKYLIPEEWNKDEIINAINLINELSHGLSFMDSGAQAMSTRSVQKAIRQLICVLYNKDPQHIESLYQPTSKRKWSNAKRSIQEWSQGLVQA